MVGEGGGKEKWQHLDSNIINPDNGLKDDEVDVFSLKICSNFTAPWVF